MFKSNIYGTVSIIHSIFPLKWSHPCLDYTINNDPEDEEIERIRKQWNQDDFWFLHYLEVSISLTFSRCSYVSSILGMVFFVDELLIKKWNNDNTKCDELVLSLNLNSLVGHLLSKKNAFAISFLYKIHDINCNHR